MRREGNERRKRTCVCVCVEDRMKQFLEGKVGGYTLLKRRGAALIIFSLTLKQFLAEESQS